MDKAALEQENADLKARNESLEQTVKLYMMIAKEWGDMNRDLRKSLKDRQEHKE